MRVNEHNSTYIEIGKADLKFKENKYLPLHDDKHSNYFMLKYI